MTAYNKRLSVKKFAVYGIQCTKNRKIYIGATCNIQQRVHTHFLDLRGKRHTNKYLQEDFNTYGEEAFVAYKMKDQIPYGEHRVEEQKFIEKYRTREEDYGYNVKHKRIKQEFKIIDGLPEEPVHPSEQ